VGGSMSLTIPTFPIEQANLNLRCFSFLSQHEDEDTNQIFKSSIIILINNNHICKQMLYQRSTSLSQGETAGQIHSIQTRNQR
jgi:hypothetical protein